MEHTGKLHSGPDCLHMFACVFWDVSHVSLVLKCGAHSVRLNNEFSRLSTEEPTLLITQINKHADEQRQRNKGNTTGSVSSVADSEDNYRYPPTPSLPFKHPLPHLLFSHLLLGRLSPLLSHARIFFLSLLFLRFLSLLLCHSASDVTQLLASC